MGKAISGKAIREMRERERKAHRLEKRIKVATRLTHLNYLIVCEGEKTEPNYFKALVKGRNSQVLTATIEGEGASGISMKRLSMPAPTALSRPGPTKLSNSGTTFISSFLILR